MASKLSHPIIDAGDHKGYMEYALQQARLSPPAPTKFCVGAVLVDADKNEILSTGYSLEVSRNIPGDPGKTHAEQCCFTKVAEKYNLPEEQIGEVLPKNTVLYTTMEPCNKRLSGHRTCVDRILRLNGAIKVVYVGISEPEKFIGENMGKKRLEDAGIVVTFVEGMQDLILELSLQTLPVNISYPQSTRYGSREKYFQGRGGVCATSALIVSNVILGQYSPLKLPATKAAIANLKDAFASPRSSIITNYDGADDLEIGGGNIKVDPNVAAELPKGCRVLSTEGHGVSFWANTGRIDVELADGTLQSFFIKVISKELGKNMVHGEFESMRALHALLPDFAPKPIAWGTYKTVKDTHFFLCEFRDMTDEMPDPHKFAARLAALHRSSKSPNGKFGFHMTTYSGNLPR
ncbi:hypothetical protein MMC17_008622 [Xylographa soralifera]|nr:hypothetical protein [Xylographa soralifera]